MEKVLELEIAASQQVAAGDPLSLNPYQHHLGSYLAELRGAADAERCE